MLPATYQRLAARTECNQKFSYLRMQQLTPNPNVRYDFDPAMLETVRLNHAILGISGEAGELADLLLKHVYYGKEKTRQQFLSDFLDELGDIMWFVAQACTILGLRLDDVMAANIGKLRQRYPDKYTDALCAEENRDREAEAAAQRNVFNQKKEIKSDPDFVPPVMDYECDQDDDQEIDRGVSH